MKPYLPTLPLPRAFSLALGLAIALALGGLPLTARSVPLTDLSVLPVTIIATSLITPGGAYRLFADVNDGSLQPITTTTDVDLGLQTHLHPTPGRGRFVLRVQARDTVESDLRINLVSLDKRCMLTTIDRFLTQGSQPGRQIEITPVLTFRDGVHFPRIGGTSTICTADTGQLVLYFARPSFDMLELSAICVDMAGNSAAIYIVMLPLPTSKLTEASP